MIRVCKEESFHARQGYDIMMSLCQGTPAQKQMAQDALNRWWWPSLMMFGPSDAASVNSAQSAQWRIKLFSNDELRQRMVDQTVPQAEYLGLTVPDPDLKWNADTGHYEFGEIDWAEFNNVLRGNGPCNRERLKVRKQAWDDGEWFRDALVAHADKNKPVNKRPEQIHAFTNRRTKDNIMSKEWPLWEVFIRSQHGLAHKHVGSLHAPDAEMAINNARASTPAATKASASGSSRRPTSSPAARATRPRCSNHPTTRSTVIRRSSRCRKK